MRNPFKGKRRHMDDVYVDDFDNWDDDPKRPTMGWASHVRRIGYGVADFIRRRGRRANLYAHRYGQRMKNYARNRAHYAMIDTVRVIRRASTDPFNRILIGLFGFTAVLAGIGEIVSIPAHAARAALVRDVVFVAACIPVGLGLIGYMVWLACTSDWAGPTRPEPRRQQARPRPVLPHNRKRYLDRPHPHRPYPGQPFDLD